MSTKNIVFIIAVLSLVAFGMVRYVALVQQEVLPTEVPSVQVVETHSSTTEASQVSVNDDQVYTTPAYVLPVKGIVVDQHIRHTIPLEDIRQGCPHRDCIPSVDEPEFVSASSLADMLSSDSLGIVIADVDRFYPFPMLETREIVNDTLPNGQAVAVTYCPLCGTGIVFDRTIDGTPVQFGVTGMLWQSNLLMYNRADDASDRNLWSQVLGQAVVGQRAGQMLDVVPSDIITFDTWLQTNPDGQTLNTGTPRDPYRGDYYGVAQNFRPDFDVATSQLPPMTRVHGIIIDGQPKAYVSDALHHDLTDIINGQRVFVEKDDTSVRFIMSNAAVGQAPTIVPDVEGFWFSWVAAHPDTLLWTGT